MTLLKRVDHIERGWRRRTQRVAVLTQAILAQAFCGEPASVLLERIHGARAAKHVKTGC